MVTVRLAVYVQRGSAARPVAATKRGDAPVGNLHVRTLCLCALQIIRRKILAKITRIYGIAMQNGSKTRNDSALPAIHHSILR